MATTPNATKTESKITTLDDAPAPQSSKLVTAEADSIKGENHDAALSGDMVTLTIHNSSEDGGKDAVFIGHNGYAYQIPRNKPWKVPREVAQVVADAVTTSYAPGPGGSVIQSEAPRHAYSIAAA